MPISLLLFFLAKAALTFLHVRKAKTGIILVAAAPEEKPFLGGDGLGVGQCLTVVTQKSETGCTFPKKRSQKSSNGYFYVCAASGDPSPYVR